MKKKKQAHVAPSPAMNNKANTPVTGLFAQAHAMQQQGRVVEAEAAYRQIIEMQPHHFDALHMLGILCAKTNRFDEAVDFLEKAASFNSVNAALCNNLGNVYQFLKNYERAALNFKKSTFLKPDYAYAFFNMGNCMAEMGRADEAIESYEQAIVLLPNLVEAHARRGEVLHQTGQLDAAIQSYERADALRPNDPGLLSGLGAMYLDCLQPEKAISFLTKAIAINFEDAKAFFRRGSAYDLMKKYDLALMDYDRVRYINPDFHYVEGARCLTKLSMCAWDGYDEDIDYYEKKVLQGRECSGPFPSLSISGSLKIQKIIADYHAVQWFDKFKENLNFEVNNNSDKIRIGYYSADFRNHPVSYLTVELLELHDRSQFEIIAFSFGVHGQDPVRQRVMSAVDQFIDVGLLSDSEIIALSRSKKIDIAIDLGGFTQNSRPDVFAMRVAPLQINYLGYPGTMGVPFMDYIIADANVIPPGSEAGYSEKVVYLPCYQANDRKREISSKVFSREELNLPAAGVVFCCFNNNYKINPPVFQAWMNILKSVEGSVLFLYAANELSDRNLKKEAAKRGVDPGRLIFAPALPPAEYLARYRVADLFLDTLPFNAGTTASDALWAGLPVLTCAGEAFAGRMATSLLHAVGLPELVMHDLASYEALAIDLGNNPSKLQALKSKLEQNRLTTTLFDTPKFVKHIEKAYTLIVDRYRKGLPPAAIKADD